MTLRPLLISLIFLISFFNPLKAQQTDSSIFKELEFIDYLLTEEDNEDAIYLLNQISTNDKTLIDSINYLKGWTFYKTKQLDSSSLFLSSVSLNSAQYVKSQFFAGLGNAYLENYEQSKRLYLQLEPEPFKTYSDLLNFELSGLSLLSGDYEDFKHYAKNFNGQNYAFKDEESRMLLYHDNLQKMSSKSPVLAGIMSAIIPGSGKIYAGKTGEGISAFLQNLVLGAITWELYRKNGPSNGFFIASATVFSFFYIGNIWGSALSVNIKKAEYQHEIKHRILFDMHIPLRTLFP